MIKCINSTITAKEESEEEFERIRKKLAEECCNYFKELIFPPNGFNIPYNTIMTNPKDEKIEYKEKWSIHIFKSTTGKKATVYIDRKYDDRSSSYSYNDFSNIESWPMIEISEFHSKLDLVLEEIGKGYGCHKE